MEPLASYLPNAVLNLLVENALTYRPRPNEATYRPRPNPVPNGTPYRIPGTTTANLYVQYRFPDGALKGARLRIGARNLFDTQPPITADGYLGSLYNPYGRQLYASLGVRF